MELPDTSDAEEPPAIEGEKLTIGLTVAFLAAFVCASVERGVGLIVLASAHRDFVVSNPGPLAFGALIAILGVYASYLFFTRKARFLNVIFFLGAVAAVTFVYNTSIYLLGAYPPEIGAADAKRFFNKGLRDLIWIGGLSLYCYVSDHPKRVFVRPD